MRKVGQSMKNATRRRLGRYGALSGVCSVLPPEFTRQIEALIAHSLSFCGVAAWFCILRRVVFEFGCARFL